MFNCCGCPSKKRQVSEDEDEEKPKTTEVIQPPPVPEQRTTSTTDNGVPIVKKEEVQKKEVKIEEVQRKEVKIDETIPLTEVDEVPPVLTPRKSSLKKPKPRLSISAEVKIIPNNFEFDEEIQIESPVVIGCEETVTRKDGRESPLSDEVFAGAGSDPPRPNLGVSLPVAGTPAGGVEFPRSQLLVVDQACGLDVPMSPRVKVLTPHPVKRGSMPAVLPRWLSEEEDEGGGSLEPPVTPVAKDELALRRHRFFADLLSAAQAATEHRVRFDPLEPEVAKESDTCAKDLDALLDRLEKITLRLEKTVPIIEETLEPLTRNIVVTKSLEDLLDEHLTPTEKEKISCLISDKIIISPDSSADVEDLSDKDCAELSADSECPKEDHSAEFETLPELEPEVSDFDNLPSQPSGDSDNLPSQPSGELQPPVDSEDPESPPIESGNGDLSDRETDLEGDFEGDRSSDSPDTVVCEHNGEVLSKSEERDLKMTNSQSTLSMSVQGYQDILQGPFSTYLQLSSKIGGDVADHAKIVEKAFQAQLQFLSLATQCKKPADAELASLLQPTSQHIQAIQEFREKHRTSPLFNHLSAVSESVPALGWVTVSPAPSPFVKEMNDAGQFYTNRVLKDWKEKDKTHVEWTKAWVQTLSELQGFVKQHHTTGLVWSGFGGVPARNGPPPPPGGPMPPPPPPLDLDNLDLGSGPGDDRSALFAEINRGTDVTKGLKKVTSEMQTHKNPGLRSGPAPFKAPVAAPTPVGRAPAPIANKPPVFSRDGKKWLIEYQKGNNNLLVDGAEMNNVVYAFKCENSTVTVKGKINSIFLDSCKKTAVVFDSVVSSVEFVNCQSVQMQVLGTVPTISIDKTDGCQMYLNDKSLGVEVISSKSSEMNILVPKSNGDFTEYPVPEQFRTSVSKKGLTTTAVESTG